MLRNNLSGSGLTEVTTSTGGARRKRLLRRTTRLVMGGSVLALVAAACANSKTSDEPVATSNDAVGAFTGPAVLTQHNDSGRTGQNLYETLLTPTLVGGGNFGKVYGRGLRGTVFAQPLYVPSRSIGGGTHNIVVVATMHNMMYAFDADNASANTPYWSTAQLASPIPLPDGEIGLADYRDIWGEIGILSTPVIDATNNWVYAVAASKSGSTYAHTLYRLNLLTGAVLNSTPITATSFDSRRQSQRSALLLQNNKLYVGFGAYEDRTPYSGFLFAYDVTNTALPGNPPSAPSLVSVRITSKDSSGSLKQAGVWMAGQGPAGDGTNVFFVTGNGDFAYNTSNPFGNQASLQLGQSVVKMTLSGSTFNVTGLFSPGNFAGLNSWDADVGAAGVSLIPGTPFLLTGGKEGMFYVIDSTTNLGLQQSGDTQIKQKFRVKDIPSQCPASAGWPFADDYLSHDCNHIHGSPVFFKDSSNTLRAYVWAENDYLRAFTWNPTAQSFNCGGVPAGAVCQGSVASSGALHKNTAVFDGNTYGMPGGMLSVSGSLVATDAGVTSAATNGIIWGTHAAQVYDEDGQYPNDAEDASPSTSDGILVAYDAVGLNELWNSELTPNRDDMGAFVKFNYPTVSGGQVFTPTSAGISNKVPIGGWPAGTAATNKGPAITTLGSTLVYAWRNSSDGVLKVRSASDERTATPGTWSGTTSLSSAITDYEPSMVSNGTKIFLAWTDTNSRINVISTTSTSFSSFSSLSETEGTTVYTPINELTNAGPALAYGNSRLFLAWKEPTLGLIRVMSSTDGITFNQSTKLNMGEGSDNAPGLFYADNTLYLVWVGPDRQLNVMKSTDNGASFTGKTTYGYLAGRGPSIIGLPSFTQSGQNTDLYMVYSNYDQITTRNLCVMSADNSAINAFGAPHKMKNIETNERPSTTLWNNKAYVAWTDLNGRPMIGRWSPGELVVYGKLAP